MVDFWRSLGRKDAINWIAVAFLLVQQLNGVRVANLELNVSGNETHFYLAVVLPFVPFALMLAAGRYLLNPLVPQPVRPVTTLLVFEIAIVIRLWTFDQLLMSFQLTSSTQFWSRFASAQVNQLVGLIVIAYLVASAREFSEQNQLLAKSVDALLLAQRDVLIRLSQRQQSLIRSIQSQLQSALSTLSGNDAIHDAVTLRAVIDDVVRPLSHRLGRDFTSELAADIPAQSSRIEFRELLRRTIRDNPFHPAWFVLWSSLSILATMASYVGAMAVPLTLVISALCYLLLTCSRYLWRFVPQATPSTVRIVIISLAPIVLSLMTGAFLASVAKLPSIDKQPAIFGYYFTVIWVIALVTTSRQMLREANIELTEVNSALKRQLVTENAEARMFEESVSRVLHGPVQDAVAAALLRVQQLPAGTPLGLDETTQIRRPIEDALTLLNEPRSSAKSVAESLAMLTELWGGVVTITLDLDDQAISTISASERTNSTVVELLREAISNAIRHGDASEVHVSVALSESKTDAYLRVSNNGALLGKHTQDGIGTKLFDDLTLNWNRRNRESEVVLEATVPLASS